MSPNPDRQETAGVPFPPSLSFLVALGPGFGLQFLVPLPVLWAPARAMKIAGTILAAAALRLVASAIASFRQVRSSPMLMRPATSLVIRGPYRFTRNPVYLALALLHAGIALFFKALWPLLLLAPAVLSIRFFVIAREERYLLRRFGAEYEAYCRSVRRWV